jgi:hypothetical protein
MVFMAMFPELVYGILEEKTKEQIEKSSDVRKIIFETITVGVKVNDTDCYQKIADFLLKVPEKKLKKLTLEEVEEGVGGYIACGPLD